jgi:hypothetical protein
MNQMKQCPPIVGAKEGFHTTNCDDDFTESKNNLPPNCFQRKLALLGESIRSAAFQELPSSLIKDAALQAINDLRKKDVNDE